MKNCALGAKFRNLGIPSAFILMMTVEEYLLKAENYAFAARTAPPDQQKCLIRAAAICRNRALRLTLAARKQVDAPTASPQAFRRSY
jgi:hypothetical protein